MLLEAFELGVPSREHGRSVVSPGAVRKSPAVVREPVARAAPACRQPGAEAAMQGE